MALESTQPLTPPSCADCLEIWKPQPPGTLRAPPSLYRNYFIFFTVYEIHVSCCNMSMLRENGAS